MQATPQDGSVSERGWRVRDRGGKRHAACWKNMMLAPKEIQYCAKKPPIHEYRVPSYCPGVRIRRGPQYVELGSGLGSEGDLSVRPRLGLACRATALHENYAYVVRWIHGLVVRWIHGFKTRDLVLASSSGRTAEKAMG